MEVSVKMFLIISNQIIKMCLLLIAGFICFKTGIVDHRGNKTLSNLLLLVINPIMIINSFQIEYSPHLLQGFLFACLLAILTHAAGIAVTTVLIPKKEDRDYQIERFSSMYSNCGFMGIPLVSSILGSEGVLYLTAYIVVFNVFCWTHGLMVMTGNMSLQQLKKGLSSPVIFGSAIGLILFCIQFKLPPVLGDTLTYLADLNTPVAMLIAGISLAETSLGKALKNPRLYLVTGIKLLVIPMIMLVIFSFLPINDSVLFTILIAAACPVATTGTMFSLRFDKNFRYASEIFAFTTVASLATIPLLVFLAEHFL